MKSFFHRRNIYIDHYDITSTGISLNEFYQRRHSLVNLIRNYLKTEEKQSSKDFTICLPSSTRLFMGPDVAYYPFKQQSDFYYLTGCMQPDAVLLLNGNNEQYSTNLFLSQCSMYSIDEYERWFGKTITDKNKICEIFGIDHVYSIDELTSVKIPSSSALFYNSQIIDDSSINKKNLRSFLKRFSSSIVCEQLNFFLHSLRSIKSITEQNLIRQACQLTSKAFIQTIKKCQKTIQNEYLIKSRFQYECQILDNTFLAFNPVVAANGRYTLEILFLIFNPYFFRSNIIHYQKNNQPINKDDLIMLDGGCLFKQYCSDITRFWPINGIKQNCKK
jgi:Xaa-Pro aminopeptidase